MRLLRSITSYYILSVYLLSAALLSIVVVASPISISSQANSDVVLKFVWRIPGEAKFRSSRSGRGSKVFKEEDQFSLFITGDAFTAVLEPQVVLQDSTLNARRIQITSVAPPPPRATSGILGLTTVFEPGDGVIAHFVCEKFFQQHYDVIMNVDRLCAQTNALLREKAETYTNILMPGDPNLRHPIDIQDDLDWINTVFLYLTLIKQPGVDVPVLDVNQLGGWVAVFTKMTDLRTLKAKALHLTPLKPKAL
ncbi:hypothetical protein F5050DRAFT_1235134 [Lentinula boryana]|uniref:Uncharacterized protein n=1 Tax=Lentinula boryana TaxID=40481 RepID=A0ABQ8PY05_9AGAR|nr:hypothetical protein F5050DRAFT_1235134 [Lentinula boryana]